MGQEPTNNDKNVRSAWSASARLGADGDNAPLESDHGDNNGNNESIAEAEYEGEETEGQREGPLLHSYQTQGRQESSSAVLQERLAKKNVPNIHSRVFFSNNANRTGADNFYGK